MAETPVKTNPYVKINIERCKNCGYCVAFCPKGVLKISEELNSKGFHFPYAAEPDKCTGCAICAMMCPDVCIEVYK